MNSGNTSEILLDFFAHLFGFVGTDIGNCFYSSFQLFVLAFGQNKKFMLVWDFEIFANH